MIKLKIDCNKFLGAKLFIAKNGTKHVAIPLESNNIFEGAIGCYLNLDINDLQETNQYGQTHTVKIDLGKDRRDEKVYVGNGTEYVFNNDRPKAKVSPPPSYTSDALDDDSDIPF